MSFNDKNPMMFVELKARTKDQFMIDPELKHFYQAEVLVPSPIPPDLILFAPEMTVDSKLVVDACVSPASVFAFPDVVFACPASVSSAPAFAPVSVCPQGLKQLQVKKYADFARCFDDFVAKLKDSSPDPVKKPTSVRRAASEAGDEEDDEV